MAVMIWVLCSLRVRIFSVLLDGDTATIINEANAMEAVEAVKTADTGEWSEAVFTSYSAGDGYTPGTIMASGKTVYEGAIACPRDITLGTVIEVKGYGTFTCEDRKSLEHNGEFDIYSESIEEAIQFGVKNLEWRVK